MPTVRGLMMQRILRGAILTGIAGTMLSFSFAAVAGPQGGQVVSGQATITNPNSSTTVINQTSNRTVIDWSSFNVAPNESVNFQQPSVSAAALNRIFDQNPSQILGSINSNGQVYLLNPNGIVFGKSAAVNVGALFATGLNISNSDFMNGKLNFAAAAGQDGGYVINHGLLQATAGGSINLIGGGVYNDGVIVANLGQVSLAAGSAVTVDFDGDGLMQFQVSKPALHNMLDAQTGAAVTNAGTVEADGGAVVMTANVAQNIFAQAVNNAGLVQAQGIQQRAGAIYLTGNGSDVVNSGSLDASSVAGNGGSVVMQSDAATELRGTAAINVSSASGKGGKAEILGYHVGLFDHASVNASGATGGGTILAGGNAHGAAGVQTASAAILSKGASLNADATRGGNGGNVVLWSNEYTGFFGSISATGGSQGGNGGFVETSSHDNLQVFGSVATGASQGKAGDWLLDPFADVTICSSCTTTNDALATGVYAPSADGAQILNTDLQNALKNGTNIVVTTNSTGTGTGTGNILINAPLAVPMANSKTATLTLQAANGISFGASTDSITNSAAGNGILNLVLLANDADATNGGLGAYAAGGNTTATIAITAPITLANGGTFTAKGPNFSTDTNGTINTTGAVTGAVDLSGISTGISLGANITTQGAAINLGTAPVTLTGTSNTISLDTTGGAATAGANITLGTVDDTTAGSEALTLNGGTGGTVTLSGALGGGLALGAVSLTGGSIALNNITTNGGAVTVTGATTLGAATTIDTTNGGLSAAGANITFSGAGSTIDGGFGLTLTGGTGGAIDLQGAVGGTPLSSFSATGASISAAAVSTSGAQSYTGATTLNGNVTSVSGNLVFNSNITVGAAITVKTGASITVAGIDATAATIALQADDDNNSVESLTVSGAFTNATNISLTGGTDLDDTLVGPALSNTWNISGANSGTLNGAAFSDFVNLTGGSAADAFDFTGATSALSGALNGGGASSGNDTLNYTGYGSAVAIDLNAGTASGITGGISNLTAFTG
ncbi:MAG TPA: filamentous hemagglutinin N-terminal domain-containing protein, partial [Gammaproteobacteria bacterium]